MKLVSNLLTIVLILSCLSSCSTRFDNFQLDKAEILHEQTLGANHEYRETKFFVDRLRDESRLNINEFNMIREILSATLEKQGHKRVYKREDADFVLFVDMKINGPYILKRTAINKVWTNFEPEFNFGFSIEGAELQYAYEYLKRVRNIKTWKMHKEKFLFDNSVYMSVLEIRAFDLLKNKASSGVDNITLSWYSKLKSLDQSKKIEDHLYKMMSAYSADMGKVNIEKPIQTTVYNNDTYIEELKNLVISENLYQDQRKKSPLFEEFRNLTEEEFELYYSDRIPPFDITPLYRN